MNKENKIEATIFFPLEERYRYVLYFCELPKINDTIRILKERSLEVEVSCKVSSIVHVCSPITKTHIIAIHVREIVG